MRSSPADQPRPQRRRWFQFSLRTLLIVVAVVAGLAFGYAKLVEPYRLLRDAMAVITKLGGTYKTEDATGWIKHLDKNAQDVVVVDLADCDKPDEYLPQLARLPRLRTLVVGGHSVGDEQVAALERVGSLKGLVLDSTLVGDEGVERLKGKLPDLVVYKSQRRACVELKKLDILLEAINDKGFAQEAVPDWLKSELGDVYFDNWPIGIFLSAARADDADLHWLANVQDVQFIFAKNSELDGSFLRYVTDSPAFSDLTLTGSKVTNATLAHVVRFAHLTVLNLDATAISDDGLTHVASLKQLETLNVSGARVTDDGLRRIMGLLHLQHLYAMDTSIGDKGLAFVVGLPALETLSLHNTQVTDDGLGYLQRLKGLKVLFLSGSKITDKGIPALQRCSQLTYLVLDGTAISADGAKRLRSALRGCSVDYVDGTVSQPVD